MGAVYEPLRRAANPVPREQVVDASSDVLRDYLESLPPEERAKQLESMLRIAYSGTKELLSRREDLPEPAAEAVSDLSRTFSQTGNWVASAVVTKKY